MRARDNPFRSACIDRLAFRDPEVTPAALLERWLAGDRRGALVGPHGTGKSTLLGELARRLEGLGRPVVSLRVSFDDPPLGVLALRESIARCGDEAVLCVDGFDGLSGPARLYARGAWRGLHGVLVTSHRPCAVPTLHCTRTSARLLEDIVHELAGGDTSSMRPEIERLHARYGGNVRDALFALYEQAARRAEVQGHSAQ